MPFITDLRRDAIENDYPMDMHPGDLCYIHYKKMVDQWKDNPRWTTAHEIYYNIVVGLPPEAEGYDNVVAQLLAWQVFFQLYVMPYELKKREENGDI